MPEGPGRLYRSPSPNHPPCKDPLLSPSMQICFKIKFTPAKSLRYCPDLLRLYRRKLLRCEERRGCRRFCTSPSQKSLLCCVAVFPKFSPCTVEVSGALDIVCDGPWCCEWCEAGCDWSQMPWMDDAALYRESTAPASPSPSPPPRPSTSVPAAPLPLLSRHPLLYNSTAWTLCERHSSPR